MRQLIINSFLLLTALFVSANLIAQNPDDCVFDTSTQTDEFVRKIPEFSDYDWDNDLKEAKIRLANGNTLVASRGGCQHFGISGTLKIRNTKISIKEQEYWLEQGLWIAERIFEKHDFIFLKNSIKDKKFVDHSNENQLYILFDQENYSDFSMTVDLTKDRTELYIGYYF